MNIKKNIEEIESYVNEGRKTYDGLPEDVLFFVSRMTPIINVDLLVKNEDGDVLLSWRKEVDDVGNKDTDWPGCGTGWHFPGSIVRYKEKLTDRVEKCMLSELGIIVPYNPVPIATNELILEHESRGHFVSFLFECNTTNQNLIHNSDIWNNTDIDDTGYIEWHKKCPDNLIKLHDMYRSYM